MSADRDSDKAPASPLTRSNWASDSAASSSAPS